ncbi:hypothetical protein WDU94_008894 [Cyamophila willieti]
MKVESKISKACEVDANVPGQSTSTSHEKMSKNTSQVSKSQEIKKKKVHQKHFCKYCKKKVSQLPRHLRSVHQNEKEIANIKYMSPKRKSRKWKILRKTGAILYNESCTDDNSIICSRPGNTTNPKDYGKCEKCNCFYLLSALQKHFSRCKRSKMAYELTQFPIDDAMLIENVLNNMIKDEIFEIVSKDELILKFGSRILSKNTKDTHIFHHTSVKMRELGRLVFEVRKHNNIQCLQELINPKHFKSIVQAAKDIAEFNNMTNTFKIPSLVLKLGFSLEKCISILELEASYAEDSSYLEQLKFFRNLYQKDWNFQLSNHAYKTLETQKWNKKITLPLASDVSKLVEYLEKTERDLHEKLETADDSTNIKKIWEELAETTLCHLVVFNRKRSGEISRMPPLECQFLECTSNVDYDTQNETLTDVDSKLNSLLKRIVIRGKKGRGVAVLLTPQLLKCCKALMKHRPPTKSKTYFFASNSKTYLRGSDCLRVITKKLNLPNITSTTLRKHIATVVGVMSLKNQDLEDLAQFLGHRLDVHKEFYRISNDITQRVKIGKLLFCLSKGKQYINNFKNKTLDEIEITDDMLKEIGNEEIGDTDTDEENEVSEISDNMLKEIGNEEFADTDTDEENEVSEISDDMLKKIANEESNDSSLSVSENYNDVHHGITKKVKRVCYKSDNDKNEKPRKTKKYVQQEITKKQKRCHEKSNNDEDEKSKKKNDGENIQQGNTKKRKIILPAKDHTVEENEVSEISDDMLKEIGNEEFADRDTDEENEVSEISDDMLKEIDNEESDDSSLSVSENYNDVHHGITKKVKRVCYKSDNDKNEKPRKTKKYVQQEITKKQKRCHEKSNNDEDEKSKKKNDGENIQQGNTKKRKIILPAKDHTVEENEVSEISDDMLKEIGNEEFADRDTDEENEVSEISDDMLKEIGNEESEDSSLSVSENYNDVHHGITKKVKRVCYKSDNDKNEKPRKTKKYVQQEITKKQKRCHEKSNNDEDEKSKKKNDGENIQQGNTKKRTKTHPAKSDNTDEDRKFRKKKDVQKENMTKQTRKSYVGPRPTKCKKAEESDIDDTDADETYTPRKDTFPYTPTKDEKRTVRRKLFKPKKWKKWTSFEEKIIRHNLKNCFDLGKLPSIDETKAVSSILPSRSNEEIRQKVRRLLVVSGKYRE